MNSHYSQLGARRAGNTTNWKAKEKYLIGQTRLFILKDTLMPPDAIVNSAEKRVRIGADGALTEEVSELDADGETDHQACKCIISLVSACTNTTMQSCQMKTNRNSWHS
jgi:hypothetical protein